jgi:class 3 adenylate cyclase
MHGIGWRMAGIFWLLAFLPALAATWYWFVETTAHHEELQAEALQDTAARIANRLSQSLTDIGRLNAFLALNPELSRLLATRYLGDAEGALATLHRAIVANPDIELIMIMDRDGNVATSTDPELIGRHFGFREYFRLAIQGRPHVTGLVVGAASGNTGVFFSHPITTGNGQVIGACVIKIVGRAFIAMVEGERKSKAQTAFLIDGDGVVMYHPNPEWMYRSLMPLTEKAQGIIRADQRYRLPKIESLDIPALHQAVTTYRIAGSARWHAPKAAEPERGGYAHVPRQNWTAIVSAEERHLALSQLRLERVAMAVAAAMLLAFVAAFALLLLTLVKPLRGLRSAAARIVRGDYRGTRAQAGTGELGEIAGALNFAADELHRRQREREADGRILVPEVRHKLLPRRSEGGNLAHMAVVYCGVAGIHELSDRRSSGQTLATVGDYAELVSEIVRPWGGQINSIGGASIVAVFAAPLTDANLESRALSAALAIQRRIAEFQRAREEANEPVVQVTIGMCTASVLVTDASSAYERHLNAMLNDGVNVAGTLAELSLQTPDHPVLINHTTYVGVRNRTDIVLDSMGPQKLRGRAELSEVYRVAFMVQAPLAPPSVVAIAARTEAKPGS